MGIRNVALARNMGLALILSVSLVWAQQADLGGEKEGRPRGPDSPEGRAPGPLIPGQDPSDRVPFIMGQGPSGRILGAPSTLLRVELYRDMMLVDTTISNLDGTFKF